MSRWTKNEVQKRGVTQRGVIKIIDRRVTPGVDICFESIYRELFLGFISKKACKAQKTSRWDEKARVLLADTDRDSPVVISRLILSILTAESMDQK